MSPPFLRRLDLPGLLARKSFFLFGPRGTGKSFLVREQLGGKALVLDLLRSDLYLRLAANPSDLEEIAAAAPAHSLIVLDEVQKLPPLLDEVHRLIESRGLRFLLTGSSARKLRRGQANLLAGRAWTASLFPLSFCELPGFDLDRMLRYGGLPSVVLSQEPEEDLRAYVHTYLYEEVQAEGLVRRLPAFSRFLVTAALANGQLLNFAQIASDAAAPASTVREYYSILEDTLLGFLLPAWTKSTRRKAIATSRFYFFDTGIWHALIGTRVLERNTNLYGRSFEHFIAMELRAYLGYARRDDPLCFWRSKHGHEVDFVIGDHVAVEVKASRKITKRDLHGLCALQDEEVFRHLLLVSQDPTETRSGAVRCVHYRTFLTELWDGSLL